MASPLTCFQRLDIDDELTRELNFVASHHKQKGVIGTKSYVAAVNEMIETTLQDRLILSNLVDEAPGSARIPEYDGKYELGELVEEVTEEPVPEVEEEPTPEVTEEPEEPIVTEEPEVIFSYIKTDHPDKPWVKTRNGIERAGFKTEAAVRENLKGLEEKFGITIELPEITEEPEVIEEPTPEVAEEPVPEETVVEGPEIISGPKQEEEKKFKPLNEIHLTDDLIDVETGKKEIGRYRADELLSELDVRLEGLANLKRCLAA